MKNYFIEANDEFAENFEVWFSPDRSLLDQCVLITMISAAHRAYMWYEIMFVTNEHDRHAYALLKNIRIDLQSVQTELAGLSNTPALSYELRSIFMKIMKIVDSLQRDIKRLLDYPPKGN